MTTIKQAIERLKIIDELNGMLLEMYKSADDQREYLRGRIDEEVREANPDIIIDGPEYQRASEENWRWYDLEEMHARMDAISEMMNELKKLAGIK